MKIGVLGTGTVGKTIATKLLQCGHDVVMGSRDPNNSELQSWVSESSGRGDTFEVAASHAEAIVNCTAGAGSMNALEMAKTENISGKLLIDVANPLDFSRGMPPSLSIMNTESLGEKIQTSFPNARVVKTLNTVNADVMVNPSLVSEEHMVFLCGNDEAGKHETKELLKEFGWIDSQILDLGDITAARGMEAYLLLWLRIFGAVETPHFNIRVVKS